MNDAFNAQKLQLPEDSYLTYLDLAATAIAADIVPLTGENRILAYYGLEKVNQNPCPGIKALLQLSKVEKKMLLTNLVFVIAPRYTIAHPWTFYFFKNKCNRKWKKLKNLFFK